MYPDLRDNLSAHIDALIADLNQREKRAESLRSRHASEKIQATSTTETHRSVLTFRRLGGGLAR